MHVGHSEGHFLVEGAYNSGYDVSYCSTDEIFLLLGGSLKFWIQFDLRLPIRSNVPSFCLSDLASS